VAEGGFKMEEELRAIIELAVEYAVKTGQQVNIAGFPEGNGFGFNKTHDISVGFSNEASDVQ
jgi:hypothetical protein